MSKKIVVTLPSAYGSRANARSLKSDLGKYLQLNGIKGKVISFSYNNRTTSDTNSGVMIRHLEVNPTDRVRLLKHIGDITRSTQFPRDHARVEIEDE